MNKTSVGLQAWRKRLIELIQADKGKQLIVNIGASRAAYRDPRAALLNRKEAVEDVSESLERDLRSLADLCSGSIRKLKQHQHSIFDAGF